MILKWINSVLLGNSHRGEENNNCARNASKKGQPEMIDVAHEAMKADAEELSGLVRIGRTSVERNRRKNRIKDKVKNSILPELDEISITEEVTERILDASEFDPKYAEIFDVKTDSGKQS